LLNLWYQRNGEKTMPLISTNYGEQMIETQEVEKVGATWNRISGLEILHKKWVDKMYQRNCIVDK
jgi:hypothetical protein